MSAGAAVAPWPPGLAGSPAAAVIERAIARGRLAHSLLLQGGDSALLAAAAEAVADRLLNEGGARTASFTGSGHPDCFVLRPAGKMRQISADATRELIAKVQVTASSGTRKVAIVHDADRMNLSAANIFLKTLEEPPAHTTLLLLSTRPHALLPTIRSRVLQFRLAPASRRSADAAAKDDPWAAWLADYRAWLGRLADGPPSKTGASDLVLSVYGLTARFGLILQQAVDAAWEGQKASLPPELEEEERIAIETGLANGLRARLFAEIEDETRLFAQPRLLAGDESVRRSLAGAIERLEHDAGLLRLNLNESAALEDFLLSSLRLWARR